MEVVRTIDLPCDVDRAWAVLTDWERQASWMRDADRVTVTSVTREGIGVRLAVRTRLFGIPAFTEPMEVTAWDPPRHLALRHGGPISGEGTWTLAPIPGATAFTWTERVRLGVPVVGGVAAWCYRPVLARLMGGAQRGLRDVVARDGA